MIQKNLSTKQKQTHRKQTSGCQEGGRERDELLSLGLVDLQTIYI